MSVNKVNDWLRERGIVPDFHLLLDPKEWVAEYVKNPHPKTTFLVSHQCHSSVVRGLRLKGARVYLWVSAANFYGVAYPPQILVEQYKNHAWTMVAGATTVGLRAPLVGYQLGFRGFHMFGMDSSMREDATQKDGYRLHAFPKDRPPDAEEGTVTLYGKYPFRTNTHMEQQVKDFDILTTELVEKMKSGVMDRVDLRVYGSGLLPAYAASLGLHADPAMNEKYQHVVEEKHA